MYSPTLGRFLQTDPIGNISPEAWQQHGFLEAFYDRSPDTYSIFERERDIILSEDP
jgi:hypothetical protein